MQISAGTLFEMLRPAAFVLAVLLSAWVLADARRRGLRTYAVGAWTLLTLLSPPVVFPLYLAARMLSRRLESAHTSSTADASEATASNQIVTAETTGETATETETTVRSNDDATRESDDDATPEKSAGTTESSSSVSAPASPAGAAGGSPLKWRRALPLFYAASVLSLAALFFLRDYRSVDAHLARAEDAKLFLQTERAIREYRAALRLENDAHTRKLLAVELVSAGRTEEALAEFLAAERGGEPDERLPYHIAAALDQLSRPAESQHYYRKFLNGSVCARTHPDARCAKAQARLKDF